MSRIRTTRQATRLRAIVHRRKLDDLLRRVNALPKPPKPPLTTLKRVPTIQMGGTTTALVEATRTYQFADSEVALEHVVELTVRPSGSHRITTADGHLHYIATGWLAIHIDPNGEGWTI